MDSFWNRARKLEQRIFGMNQRNVELIYPNNQRKHYPLADDKIKAKAVLEKHNIACAATYAIIEKLGEIEQQWEKVQAYSALAIKPANGSGGGGILILKKDQDGQWTKGGKPIQEVQIFRHLANILMGVYSLGMQDRVLIEKCIEPHPFFHEIYPAGVPDFRVILLKSQPLLSMLRVPTDRSDGKANLHQGGLGIGIDMSLGILKEAFDGKKYHRVHPDNNNPIAGKLIPDWPALIDLAIATADSFPLDFLGIDIVIDRDLGPLIMEVNVRPGLGIQLANKTGLQEALDNLF